MAVSRRQLLQLGLLTAAAAASSPLTASGQSAFPQPFVNRRTGPSVLQGATDETRTQFSIVHPVNEIWAFRVTTDRGGKWKPDRVETLTLAGQPTAITRVFFSGLHLGEDFKLVFEEASRKGNYEVREFRTLDTKNLKPRFAVCSCMDENRHSPEIWQDLVNQRPDFILFVGDSVYCDYGNESDSGEQRLWRRFSEARAVLEIYFSKRLVPIFAVWDDHDFGSNDVGKEFPHALVSRKNFMSFFAMEPSHCTALERGPGISSRFIIGKQQFLMMDDRSFRFGGSSNDRYAHWGREQEEWMLARTASHAGMSWVINGSQVFPQMPFKESFSGQHPVQFAAICKALQKLKQKIVILTGDVHFSEISEIEPEAFGYKTYELTSSSIHSFKLPGAPVIIPNDRRIASTGEHNYILIQSEGFGYGARFKVECRSPMNEINFEMELSV